MVDKLTKPKSGKVITDKINEVIDAVQDLNEKGIICDSALSSTSENPVQNKVITSALNGKVNTSDYVAYTAGEVETLWGDI